MKRIPIKPRSKNKPLWKDVKQYLKKYHPETAVWSNCDEALCGVARIYRENKWVQVAIYDYDALVEVFYKDFKESPMDEDSDDDIRTSAIEWVDYNIVGAYIGKHTPIYSCEGSLKGF